MHVEDLNPPDEVLEDRNLFSNIDNDLAEFVVGEEQARRVVLLVALGGSLVTNAHPTSRNILVNDESGVGKDHLCRSVVGILPDGMVEKAQRVSEKALSYWHNAKIEPSWTWDGKVFYGEDATSSFFNSPVFKVLASSEGETRTIIVDKGRPVEILVRGKPTMILTSASASPTSELLRRFPIVSLNATAEQTRKIIQLKARRAASGLRPRPDGLLKEAMSRLRRVSCVVPFAPQVAAGIPDGHVIARTTISRMFDYCSFSAAIHQRQREADLNGHLIATQQDYEIARSAINATMTNALQVPLTKRQQGILSRLKEVGIGMTTEEVAQEVTTISEKQLRRELQRLVSVGFVKSQLSTREGIRRQVSEYSFTSLPEFHLPEWDDLPKGDADC